MKFQFSSVAQLCPTVCNPMDCNTPGLPVHRQYLELAQTHVHRVSDTIQPSHPLSSPSPLALNLFQHWGLFQWIGSSHQVAKYWSFGFSISTSNEYSGLISFWKPGLMSFQFKGLSRVFSNTTVQKYPFFSSQLSLSYYVPKDVIFCSKFAPLSTKSPFKSSEFRFNIPTMRIIVLDQIIFQ